MTITSEDLKYVQSKFDELKGSIKNLESNTDVSIIDKAFELSLKAFEEVPYKFNRPYILYPLEVALIAAKELGLGTNAIISVLLREGVTQNIISFDLIKSYFGETVNSIIRGLNKLDQIETRKVFEKFAREQSEKEIGDDEEDSLKKKKPKKRFMTLESKLTLQSDYFTRMMLTITDDVRVILLKLAYRLYDINHIKMLPDDEKIWLSKETGYLYAPISHKLGLYNIKTEMEEISMKYNHPEMYRFIAKKLDETRAQRNEFIQSFIEPIKEELNKKGFRCDVKGRPKSMSSIWNKMKKQGVDFEGIYDLFAIRIIINNEFKDLAEEKEACWRIYSIITNVYLPNPKRLRDWISSSKSSGYESLHTTVMGPPPERKWVEVQIRTQRMDDIAERGDAAHWKYKAVKGGDSIDEWHNKVRELLESPDPSLLDDKDEAKIDLYSEKIFVFTPKGEIRSLPKKATVLDFAFAIHSRIGEQCVGAKIKNVVVPIKHVLSNGDTVEILTSKIQKPKKEWLKIVVSPRVKNRIKRALRQEDEQFANIGKEIVTNELRKYNLEINDKLTSQYMLHFSIKSFIAFYSTVGRSEIDVAPYFKELYDPKVQGNKEVLEHIQEQLIEAPTTTKSHDFLVIDEIDKIDFELAKCCNPIPGDLIFGFISATRGTKIHKINCPNASDMLTRHPYRMVKARWTDLKNKPVFSTSIHIKAYNSIGMLANIVNIISHDLKINMGDVNINSQLENMFDAKIMVYIYSKDHLEELMSKIRSLKGIISVEREEQVI